MFGMYPWLRNVNEPSDEEIQSETKRWRNHQRQRAEPMGIERDRLRAAQGKKPSEREGTSQHERGSKSPGVHPELKTDGHSSDR